MKTDLVIYNCSFELIESLKNISISRGICFSDFLIAELENLVRRESEANVLSRLRNEETK